MLSAKKFVAAYRSVFNLYVIDGFIYLGVANQIDFLVGALKSNTFKVKSILRKRALNVNSRMLFMSCHDDDMDDLMRIAAGESPLKIDADNWETMQALLLPKGSVTNENAEKKSWLTWWKRIRFSFRDFQLL